MHNLHIDDIQTLVELIVSNLVDIVSLDDAQLLDLLPMCLDLIRGSDEVVRAEDVVKPVMDRVFDCVWHKGLLLKLVHINFLYAKSIMRFPQ